MKKRKLELSFKSSEFLGSWFAFSSHLRVIWGVKRLENTSSDPCYNLSTAVYIFFICQIVYSRISCNSRCFPPKISFFGFDPIYLSLSKEESRSQSYLRNYYFLKCHENRTQWFFLNLFFPFKLPKPMLSSFRAKLHNFYFLCFNITHNLNHLQGRSKSQKS